MYSNFQSESDLDSRREEIRRARQENLEKAKRTYEYAEAKKEKARKEGQDTWMLDSVSQRINKEINEQKAKKKKKKKKKEKKLGKKKKKHLSNSSSSTSDGEEADKEICVEAKTKSDPAPGTGIKGPQLQERSWMDAPFDIIPTTSRQELKEAANKQKEEAKRDADKLLEPGQHVRELNPYWKGGGSGLPGENTDKSKHKSSTSMLPASTGDGGLSWLRKAHDRCKQQAKEEGRSLKEVAAERWGSLEKLESMLAEAERELKGENRHRSRTDGRIDEKRRGLESNRKDSDIFNESKSDGSVGKGRERENNRQNEKSRERDRDVRSLSTERSRDRDRVVKNSPSMESSRDRDRGVSSSPSMKRSRDRDTGVRNSPSMESSRDRDRGVRSSPSRERDRRNQSTERSRDRDNYRDSSNNRRNFSDRNHNTDSIRNADKSKKTTGFQRPGSDSEGEISYSRSSGKSCKDDTPHEKQSSNFNSRNESYKSSEQRPRHFVKPGEDIDRPGIRDNRYRQDKSSSNSLPRWKKQTAAETVKDIRKEDRNNEIELEDSSTSTKSCRKLPSRSSSSDSSSSSDHASDSEEELSSDKDKQKEESETSPAKLLSEEELNALSAKILRAEIMGDDVTATDLKRELENARKVREMKKLESGTSAPDFSHRRREEKGKEDKGRKRNDEEDNVVVLSRTSKGGLVRPVMGSSDDNMPSGGKRRKRNVATHDNKGERTMYFDDDDRLDLKTLVEQEKAGTAEDQNSMFARLAGRSNDKDLDVDDIFVSKAAMKQNEESAAGRDRAAAIFEHRKLSAAMEKCHRCFEKVPKHLIIAIGTKSYLCLPHHHSLTEGHCFIVPMQHVSAATSMDEDVWHEMQLFRKSLVQMFAAENQDMVVMETVMHLKHFPHTAIECVPLDREMGDLAPIYFKKAIQDAGPEWSDNKKLHSLSIKDVRHVIPKGFPYFSVDFGLQGGYATVIEDEVKFQSYFGREIVGGMLDAEPTLWRKPHKQSFEDQRQKVLQFAQRWQPYDWTQKLAAGN